MPVTADIMPGASRKVVRRLEEVSVAANIYLGGFRYSGTGISGTAGFLEEGGSNGLAGRIRWATETTGLKGLVYLFKGTILSGGFIVA